MKFSFKKILKLALPAVILTIIALVLINQKYQTVTVYVQQPDNNSPVQKSATNTNYSLPTTKLLSVPFTTQAPFGVWDKIHNEDCEEASAVMANAYYNGPHNVKLDPTYVDGQLTDLTNWELQNFGYNLDITSEETVQMIKANYNLQAKVMNTFSLDDIKKELNQNHLVLIPVDGQMIGNPNYRQPGPIYHMLVIRGYTGSTIITNDPGTRNGQNYSYPFDVLYNANGDFDHTTNKVDLSDKNVIVVWK